MEKMLKDKNTLSTGKFHIEQTNGSACIFTEDAEGNREWIASTLDPFRAMEIVEGLLLVEMKRFYYPESTPQINGNSSGKSIPPFLQRKK